MVWVDMVPLFPVIMVRRGSGMVLLVVFRVFVGMVLVWLMVQYVFHIVEMKGTVCCTISW